MKSVALGLIKIYQLTLSSFIGNCCRFYPSCSNYAIEALEKKTFFSALKLIIKRVARCNPLSKGGVDFVP